MAEKRNAYIGIGSNLGDREKNLNDAISRLAGVADIKVVKHSKFIETGPLGGYDQPDYLNTVVKAETDESGVQLLHIFKDIEKQMGRTAGEKWSSRCIDIDLLLLDKEVIRSDLLTVPHSQLHLRSFALRGICEIDPGVIHPVMKVKVKELADRLNGNDFCLDKNRPQLISIAGLIGVGKTTLSNALSSMLRAEIIYEPYSENPYLKKVFAGNRELALNSQLHFLVDRSKQLGIDVLEIGQVYISDYVFDKELVYADEMLSSEEFSLYSSIYDKFKDEVADPVLLIYLKDDIENCLEKIKWRKRSFEQNIKKSFLKSLEKDYEDLIAGWNKSPVITLDMSSFDCDNQRDLDKLFLQIKEYIA